MIRTISAPCARTLCKRNFFASSTDHTTLLTNAFVHCIANEQSGERQYVLIPNDTPLDLAMKVDKLHLARLKCNGNVIYGAKVVQRTLGTEVDVCMPLLEAALRDIKVKNDDALAMASLDGLCQWVSKAIENNESEELFDDEEIQSTLTKWREDDPHLYGAVKAIATGEPRPGHSVVGQGTYRDGQSGWMELAHQYISQDMASEAILYEKGGATLECIDHLANTSRESLIYAGGAMAKFKF
jgi:hypothetical protein